MTTTVASYVHGKITDARERYGVGAYAQGAGLGLGIGILVLVYAPGLTHEMVALASVTFVLGMLIESQARSDME